MKTTVVTLALLASVAFGQINYPNFSNVSGLTLNMHAAQSGNVLRVTPALISQRGSAWNSLPVPVLQGFDTTFTFQFTAPNAGGGDGMAFVIQNDPRLLTALGNHASAIGYGAFAGIPTGTAIANSLAIEFDTYAGSFGGYSDLSGNEISVHTGGTGDNSQSEGLSIGRVSPAVNMSDALVHTARIQYVPGTLKVYLDNLVTPVLTVPYNFTTGGTQILPATPVGGLNLLGGDQAVVGFTASSGAAWENHDVLSWQWTSAVTSPCYAGTVGVGLGGPYDVLTANGTAGGLTRTVFIPVNTPFGVTVGQPPSFGPAATFILLGRAGFPSLGPNFPLPIGTLCFPPSLFLADPSLFILADSWNLGIGALLPATPAPWTLNLPSGLPGAIQVSLQAVIEDAAGLAITNALLIHAQ